MTSDSPALVAAGLTQRRLVAPLALVAWIAVVLAAYYAVHKPLPDQLSQAGGLWEPLREGWSPAALASAVLDLGVALWLALLGLGVGSLLLDRLLDEPDLGPVEHTAFGGALGLAALATTVFFLGLAGGLSPLPALLLLNVLSLVGVVGLWRILRRQVIQPRQQAAPDARDGTALALQGLLAGAAALTLTKALAPPVAWDSLVYHLTAPQQHLQAGRILGGIDVPYFYFPSLVEQLYAAALLVRGDVSAQAMHLVLAALGALAVWGFLARYQDRRAGWYALALLASATSLLSLATEAYVEWGLLTYGFLAFWALHRALETGSGRWLALSGCLCGWALATKYTGVFLALALGVLLLWHMTRDRRRDDPALPTEQAGLGGWHALGLWAGPLAAAASPWYLKNWVLTGNPAYPFFFGGWRWDTWRAEWFSRPGTGLVTEPLRLLSAPWELTVLGTEGSAFYDATMGPLFLALLPLLALVPLRTWVSQALVVTAILFGVWLYGAAQSALLVQGRLLLPAMPFLAAALAGGLAESPRLAATPVRVHRVLEATVLLVLGLTVLRLGLEWVADPPLPYLLGAESRATYLERHLGDHYRALMFLNGELSPGARVLFLWEPRTYLCGGACQPDALLYNWRDLLRQYGSVDGVYQELRREGYSHVLLYGGGLRHFSEPPNVEMEPAHIVELARFEARYLDRLYGPPLPETLAQPASAVAGKGYALYRLR
ncbi:MAG: glycosyltransferase family 39 protein [Chloroflexi bacterium]|nr:glycosyltransferase family 39 protein [Chloroflexota bacterium]